MLRRDVVDHALARRALLRSIFGGGLFTTTSAYGVPTDRTCPICRKEPLADVAWVYGDAIGDYAGSARSPAQLAALAAAYPDFSVHEVEVCQACGWNHLVRSFRTGTPGTAPGPPRTAPKRSRLTLITNHPRKRER